MPAGRYKRDAGGQINVMPAGRYKRDAGGQINVLPTKGSQGKLGGVDTSRMDDVNKDETDGPT